MSKRNRNKPITEQLEETDSTPIVDTESTPVEQTEAAVEETTSESQVLSEALIETTENVSEEIEVEVREEPSEANEEAEKSLPVVEEKKEKKVVPNKGVLIVEKKVIANTTKAPVSPAVAKFDEFANKYIETMDGDFITEENRKKAVMILTAMCNLVTTSSDIKVFDACYSFFLKNRAIMLVPEKVTDGLYNYADKTKVTKIVQFYVTFQSLIESRILGSRFTINTTTIRRLFNNDAFANWLILKSKKK